MKNRHTWTDDEEALVKALYPDTPCKEVAEKLGLTVHQVYQKAYALGIRKSEAFMTAEKARAGERLVVSGISGRFQKGQIPANKGKRMDRRTYAKCAKTMFKPGRKPCEARNYQPIGTERISKDGYLERKVTDDQSLVPARRWRFVHVLTWEHHNGPVPAGHVVVFRNKDKSDTRIENLELISRAELARRNSMHRFPESVKRAIRAKASLNRRINKLIAEANP